MPTLTATPTELRSMHSAMQQRTIPHHIDATALDQFINKLLPADIATAPPSRTFAARTALASFANRTQKLEEKKDAEELTDTDVNEEPRSCLIMIGEADTPLRTCTLIWIDRRDKLARIFSPGTDKLRGEWTRLVTDACNLTSHRISDLTFYRPMGITEGEDHTGNRAAIDADNASLAAIAAQLLLGVSSNPPPPSPEDTGVWRELVHTLCSTDAPLPRLDEHLRAEVASWGSVTRGESAKTASALLKYVAKEVGRTNTIAAFYLEGLLRSWCTG
ncbi:Hypothetical predicted protein [Lecanosticta acicola]|uniref:Uncharacterized protein n=1 Tax=Lecanosticta acicola TaxID=111012 RepID=A0AAI8Z589_9PEZI|nr:Hypothetical predicted protein [Lecanosticta acicola]